MIVPCSRKAAPSQSNGVSNGIVVPVIEDADESIYHLPSGLQDLLQSFEATQKRVTNAPSHSSQRMLSASFTSCPDTLDSLAPRSYKPKNPWATPPYYPQEVDPVFDDPHLYARIDPDTLFYVFYYKQETYQQYLAAKALKDQSWRFHKQYQTWFQRHEEPKTITEEFEQGTYRFFDYESTWWGPHLTNIKNAKYVIPLYSRAANALRISQASKSSFEISEARESIATESQTILFEKFASGLKLHPEYLRQVGWQ
jgi:CCR4-NOT transcription complex subunit 3